MRSEPSLPAQVSPSPVPPPLLDRIRRQAQPQKLATWHSSVEEQRMAQEAQRDVVRARHYPGKPQTVVPVSPSLLPTLLEHLSPFAPPRSTESLDAAEFARLVGVGIGAQVPIIFFA